MSTPEQPRHAVTHRSRWPGAVWAIPIAALGIVVWLGVRSWSSLGPKVTVIFPTVADLKPGDTQVKFQGMAVGKVDSVKLQDDLRHIKVELRLHSDMKGHLGKSTKFWIEGTSLSLNNLSFLRTVISGPYVSMEPASGPALNRYIGLSAPPVVRFGEQATAFILRTDKLNGIQHGTPIYYLDQKAGEVRSCTMTGSHSFVVTAMIKAPFDKLVHSGTRFWNAGAVHLSMAGNGPTLQMQSLPALVEGSIAFETPSGTPAGSPSRPNDSFQLYENQDAAENAPDSQGVSYRVVFTGVSNSLSRYAPVQLMGSVVGSVADAKMVYSPDTGQMSIRATIVMEPRHIQLADGKSWSDPRRQMDLMMQQLVAQGMRAELASSPPVIGGHMVVLRIVHGSNGAMLPGEIPELPTSSGSDITDVIQTASDVVNKVDEMPLPDIANNVHRATRHIASLVSSPALPRTLHNVDRSSANVSEVTADARQQLPAALQSTRQSLAEAQATLMAAQALFAANSAPSNQPQSAGVPKALYEVTRAARSVRELSDFLDRHPEALIAGRGTRQ